jgi:hypothetical protein
MKGWWHTLARALAAAQPDLVKPQPAGALTVFPDARRASLLFVPGNGLAEPRAAGGI